MKKRSPIFVAGFPLASILVGYSGLFVLAFKYGESEVDDAGVILILVSVAIMFLGIVYTLYWLVSTARALRRQTGMSIPNSVLLIIPLASYWWMWKYGQASEKFVKNKVQAVLVFVLIALLGAVGNAIMQDYYNKQKA